MTTENNFLTPEQVSEILQINTLTVYKYIKRGKLGAIRLGRTYRIPPEDLKQLIESNRVKNKREKNGGEK
jgi:excisionase family DNA binding protein